MTEARCFEDFEVGAETWSRPIRVTADEIASFARSYDPLAIHLEREAARAVGLPDLSASGSHILALRTALLHTLGAPAAILAALGWDEVRFHRPVHPGDALTLRLVIVETRPSKSQADRGVVVSRIELHNQRRELVFSQRDAILVARRDGGARPPGAGEGASPTSDGTL